MNWDEDLECLGERDWVPRSEEDVTLQMAGGCPDLRKT